MRHPSGRRKQVSAWIAVLIILVGVGVGLSPHLTVARPVQVATGGSIAETANPGFSFQTQVYEQVPVNSTIAMAFTDQDTGSFHTFSLLNRSDYQIPPMTSSDGLNSLFGHYHTLVNLTANPGQTVNSTFRSPAPGWYEFVCFVAGHFASGMFGFVAFGENLPANISVGIPGSAAGTTVFIIVGTIVALTVIAVALGFVAGRREGSVHEMPPERLGYPEPLGPTANSSSPKPPLS